MHIAHRCLRFCFQVSVFFAWIVPGLAQEVPRPYSMPGFSPLYSPPPIRFRDNRILSVVFKTTPDALRRLVPKPLMPNPMNLMFVYIGRLGIEGQPGGRLEYLEAGIGVPAFHSATMGNYAVCLYLDKAMPIVGGREVWGWPKKDAEITFSEKDGVIEGRVKRFGTVLLDASARLEPQLDPAVAPPEMPWFLQKIIPSARRGARPEVWQLVSTLNTDVRKKELRNCTAQLELGTSDLDALGEIEVLQVVSAQLGVGDFDMDYGQILHDYLAE